MSCFSYRWVKNEFAFPLPNARGKRQWKHSRQTIMIWAPPHHSTLRLCLFSHQPFAQAPYEMSASWLIPVFYSEWIVINASFPLLCWACFPREETTTLRQKRSHRLPPCTHSAQKHEPVLAHTSDQRSVLDESLQGFWSHMSEEKAFRLKLQEHCCH